MTKVLGSLAKDIISGSAVQEYENLLADYHDIYHCLAVSSGTAAIIVALKALNIGEDDEVLLAPTAPLCTAFPIMSTGARIVFCDTLADNFSINLNKANTIITKRTKAIVDVPMWGYPNRAEDLQNFASEKGIPLVFDLAHCHGTLLNNYSLASYCDIACYSTQKNKILSTGEGGFMLTNNADIYQKASAYSRMGNLNGIDFGLNYKLSYIQAEAGIYKLKHLSETLHLRKSNSDYINAHLQNASVREFPIVPRGVPSYHTLLLQVENDCRRFIDYLISHNIPSDIVRYDIKPLYDYPILNKFKVACPNAERLLTTVTTIPVQNKYEIEELDLIVAVINRYL